MKHILIENIIRVKSKQPSRPVKLVQMTALNIKMSPAKCANIQPRMPVL